MSAYTPQEGSIAWKVIEFFTTNPDEALTTDQMSIRFDTPAKQFHSLLGQSVETGLLKRTTNDDTDMEYSLGTGSPHIKASRARNPSPRPDALLAGSSLGLKQTGKPAVKPAAVTSALDLAAIALVDDVPMPAARQAFDWSVLFKRMKVKQSCVLPISVRSTLLKACTDAKKAGIGTFTIRKINDGELGLWRVS
jgi:hypothetical protein